MDAGIDMILTNITKIITVVLASYRFILADDVQILSPCALGQRIVFSAVRPINSFCQCLFFSFKFNYYQVLVSLSLQKEQAHQRAAGTLL